MNSTTTIVSIILAGLFTNNIVLSKFLGISSFLEVSKKTRTIFLMSATITLIMVIATAITWPIYQYILHPNFAYLETIVFVLVIVGIVELIKFLLARFLKPVYDAIGAYLPLAITNCAVLGVTILNTTSGFNFIESLVNAFSAGLGFMLALFLFAGVRQRMEIAKVPEGLKGLPITLVAAAIISLAFFGFVGLFAVT